MKRIEFELKGLILSVADAIAAETATTKHKKKCKKVDRLSPIIAVFVFTVAPVVTSTSITTTI